MKYTREGVLPRVLFTRVISFTLLAKCGSVSPGGGGLPYETDGDARRKF